MNKKCPANVYSDLGAFKSHLQHLNSGPVHMIRSDSNCTCSLSTAITQNENNKHLHKHSRTKQTYRSALPAVVSTIFGNASRRVNFVLLHQINRLEMALSKSDLLPSTRKWDIRAKSEPKRECSQTK